MQKNTKISNKIAIFSVLSDNTKKYFNNFIQSLVQQSYQNFQLFIYNDCDTLFKLNKNNKYIKLLKNSPIVFQDKRIKKYNKNRIFLMNKIFNMNFIYIIFSDCDDIFSKNRVESCIKNLRTNKIVFNQIQLLHKLKKNKNKPLLNIKKKHISFKDNFFGNNIGFSNSAIKLDKKILKIFNTIPDILTHDWYFFNLLFLFGLKAKYLKDVVTYYRLYENSLSLNHYKNSLEIFKKSVLVQLKLYESLYIKLEKLNYRQYEHLQLIENHIINLKIKKSNPSMFSSQLNFEDYLWWGLKK